ncbi:MAG: translation initiation factor IF-2 [Clostridiales bacterium]|jgi:translation initiation factor IF-2|nr:translation initiation factor IF-2 [Clostridiales bacterium]
MSKIRLHELAKDLDAQGKDLISLLKDFGFKTKNHMSALEPDEISVVLEYYTQKNQVEQFDFLLAKLVEAPKETKRRPEMTEEEFLEVISQIQSKDEKKSPIVVDTRIDNVDLEKYDIEDKIDDLVDSRHTENAADKKQKIKKRSENIKQKQQSNNKAQQHQPKEKPKRQHLNLEIPEEISVGEYAHLLKRPVAEVVKSLFQLGIMANATQIIDYDTAEIISDEFDATITKQVIVTAEEILFDTSDDAPEDLEPRSPVVVVMGHVDHGKTSLLDAIRETNVIAGEAGGITQHIGAYRVRVGDKKVTFLDTPGHEAFTAMRARGAQITDIAILVVAADDGIMPQTIEAINHAKAAGVAIIVAINKIDKEGANVDKVKQDLTEHGLVPEEWGGDTICVPISAKKHTNIEQLLEMLVLIADMKDLKANPKRKGQGAVIEARLDKTRGVIASLLVQNGTLNVGDTIIAGTCVGRIRAMVNDRHKRIRHAAPSVPVEIIGLSEVPEGGDEFYVVTDERLAKSLAEKRKAKQKQELLKASNTHVTLDNLFDHIKQGEVKELNIIIKADVQGSVEAISQSLVKLTNEDVRINIVHGGVGAISESDVMLANASNAIIVGFHVRPDPAAIISAERFEVDVRLYRVIYQAIEEIELAMKGLLDPEYKEEVLGHAEIRQTFKASGVGTIAGSYVIDGKIMRNCEVRIVRDGIVVHEGMLSSLKRFKDDAKEVLTGFECGLTIDKYNDIKVGDIVECFTMVEIPR